MIGFNAEPETDVTCKKPVFTIDCQRRKAAAASRPSRICYTSSLKPPSPSIRPPVPFVSAAGRLFPQNSLIRNFPCLTASSHRQTAFAKSTKQSLCLTYIKATPHGLPDAASRSRIAPPPARPAHLRPISLCDTQLCRFHSDGKGGATAVGKPRRPVACWLNRSYPCAEGRRRVGERDECIAWRRLKMLCCFSVEAVSSRPWGGKIFGGG